MDQEVAEHWSAVDRRIKQISNSIEQAFWCMIGLLKKVRNEQGWRSLGYGSFSEYLAQEELAFKEETVGKYIRTHEVIESVGDERFFQLPRSKLALVAPHLDEENADNWYHKAKTLSWRDLRSEIQEEVVDEGRPPRPYLRVRWDKSQECWRAVVIKNGGFLEYEGKLEDYLEEVDRTKEG